MRLNEELMIVGSSLAMFFQYFPAQQDEHHQGAVRSGTPCLRDLEGEEALDTTLLY